MPVFVNLMTISKEAGLLHAIVYKQKYTLFLHFYARCPNAPSNILTKIRQEFNLLKSLFIDNKLDKSSYFEISILT
jgi:hypothetical protein